MVAKQDSEENYRYMSYYYITLIYVSRCIVSLQNQACEAQKLALFMLRL